MPIKTSNQSKNMAARFPDAGTRVAGLGDR
jgi:hypothetical protein